VTSEHTERPAVSRWNPLASEAAAFRWLVILFAVFAVFIVVLLVARAL
jgi:hypothetical protein